MLHCASITEFSAALAIAANRESSHIHTTRKEFFPSPLRALAHKIRLAAQHSSQQRHEVNHTRLKSDRYSNASQAQR
jgi:putative heme iron utilization protein